VWSSIFRMTGAWVMKPMTCILWPHRQSRGSAS
jgi:hypothetical protein